QAEFVMGWAENQKLHRRGGGFGKIQARDADSAIRIGGGVVLPRLGDGIGAGRIVAVVNHAIIRNFLRQCRSRGKDQGHKTGTDHLRASSMRRRISRMASPRPVKTDSEIRK